MTDLSEYHWYVAVFRSIFATLDKIVYDLLAGMFNIFYMIAGAELKTNNVVTEFFGRIQLIFGIIIVFKLIISFFTAIVDPDSISDKQKGIGSIIKRVVVVLIMFILIVPLNIPEETDGKAVDKKNSMMTWNQRMNQSGILFGTMYELQSRVLNDNVIQNIILGRMDDKKRNTENNTNGDIISTYLLESFVRINLKPGEEDFSKSENWLCHGNLNKEEKLETTMNTYYSTDAFSGKYEVDYDEIRSSLLDNINMKCDTTKTWAEEWFGWVPGVGTLLRAQSSLKGERYFFVYHLLISTIIGVLFIIMVLSLTIDVAVRVFKLLLLRIISPVAILSYIDPKSEKTFNNWVKAVSTTYLDLFIRVAVISFIMLFVRILPSITFEIPGKGIIKIFAHIILMFGLLFFAKEAPKFITDTLGIDSKEGSGLFSGIGKLRASTAAVGGILSGGISNARATNGNTGRKAIAFLTGGVGGGINAGKEFFKSGSDANSIKNATRRYNQQNYERAADESTFGGRMKAGWQERLGIKTEYDTMNDKIKYYESAGAAMDRINNAFNGNGAYKFNLGDDFLKRLNKGLADAGVDMTKYTDEKGNIIDKYGNIVLQKGHEYTLKDMNDILSRVTASGDNTLIKAVDEAKKSAQGIRLNEIRSYDRDTIVEMVNSENPEFAQWTSNDLNAFDAATTIYKVSQVYSNEPEFQAFRGQDFKYVPGHDANGNPIYTESDNLSWGGGFKNSASKAKQTADADKNSPRFAAAKANAERAKEKNNK